MAVKYCFDTTTGKVYLVAVASSSAFAWGHATDQAIQLGLPEELRGAVRVVSCLLLLANLASTPLCAKFATDRSRGPLLWGFKGALAGPMAVWELNGKEARGELAAPAPPNRN